MRIEKIRELKIVEKDDPKRLALLLLMEGVVMLRDLKLPYEHIDVLFHETIHIFQTQDLVEKLQDTLGIPVKLIHVDEGDFPTDPKKVM